MRHRGPPAAPGDGASAPEERSLTDPRFIGSFPRADVVLDPPLPEVAFLGRSNVGKSTLLNALVGARVARTSRTPGKTRMMNVFEVALVRGARSAVAPDENRAPDVHRQQPRTAHPALYLLDLPGYGYARVGRGERTAFRGLLRHALERPLLAGVVWLLDLRRDPSDEDGAVQEQFAAAGVRVLAAATKSDKLPPRQRQARAGVLRGAVGIAEDQFVLTSATTGAGVDELREAIAALVSEGT